MYYLEGVKNNKTLFKEAAAAIPVFGGPYSAYRAAVYIAYNGFSLVETADKSSNCVFLFASVSHLAIIRDISKTP